MIYCTRRRGILRKFQSSKCTYSAGENVFAYEMITEENNTQKINNRRQNIQKNKIIILVKIIFGQI